MEEFNSDIENDGQFKLDLQSGSEVITNGDNEQYDDVTHLFPDELIELEVTNPDEYNALMAEIERQQEMKEIERLALESEAKENSEKDEINKNKKEDELRASIAKAYEDNNTDGWGKKQDDQFKKSIEDLYKKDPDEPYWQR